MTDLLTRTGPAPAQRRAPRAARRLLADALLAAGGALGGSAALVVLIAVVAWAADPHSSASLHSAVSVGLGALLLAQRVPVGLTHGEFTLPPLGLTLVPALLLVRAGGALVRVRAAQTVAAAVRPVLLAALAYAVGMAVLAEVANQPGERVSPVAAAAVGVVIATAMLGCGAWRALGSVRPRLRQPVADVAAAAMLGVGGVTIAAAVTAAASLIVHAHDASAIASLVGTGAVGGVVLLLIEIALAPTAALLTVGVLAGPGFALGRGTTVNVHLIHVGAVPALPMLAAVPKNGHPGHAAYLLLLLPVLAGVAMGAMLTRRSRAAAEGGADEATWQQAAGRALAAGALAAIVLTIAVALASGAAGPGRLAEVGPSAWQTGMALLAELALPAALVAALASRA